ncbi:MAG: PIN domain-containing protein [Spirochaetia bacterium]|nr:PIN domain-containing protein [Spirochaetia bacterium]MCI6810058.1 PIN domain-containing protein [Spirochaetia bacterium]MCI7036311.1 PIN domain-containing protein [Spirochaetia bacterium]MDY4985202.1 PIN domain-containing protein [Treponema sp.]
MNKYFVDTDVILDLLSQRVPHFHFSAVLFSLAEMGKFELYTSPTVMVNTFYILRKNLGNENAKNALRKLRIILHVIDSSEKVLDLALNSNFNDFEDAIQYYTALNADIQTIITRNLKDYKAADILVQTPEMFLVTNGLI